MWFQNKTVKSLNFMNFLLLIWCKIITVTFLTLLFLRQFYNEKIDAVKKVNNLGRDSQPQKLYQ